MNVTATLRTYASSLAVHLAFLALLFAASAQTMTSKTVRFDVIMEMADDSAALISGKSANMPAGAGGAIAASKKAVKTDFSSLLSKAAGANFTKSVKAPAKTERAAPLFKSAFGTSLGGKRLSLESLVDAARGAGKIQWKEIENEKSPLREADMERIAKTLSARQGDFRDCFEKALLNDPSISGHANMVLAVAGGGTIESTKIEFSGTGSGPGLELLKSCLSLVNSRITLPATLADQRVRFGLLFKS